MMKVALGLISKFLLKYYLWAKKVLKIGIDHMGVPLLSIY